MHKKCVFWLNLLSALCGFTGVALSLTVNGPKCLALYSDLTALFAGIISIVHAAGLDRAGRKDRVFRFASAVSQVLVLLFALISLLPAFSFSFSKFSPHLILMHFCAPTLSLISYFALERDGQLRFSDTLYGYLFTGMYAVFEGEGMRELVGQGRVDLLSTVSARMSVTGHKHDLSVGTLCL